MIKEGRDRFDKLADFRHFKRVENIVNFLAFALLTKKQYYLTTLTRQSHLLEVDESDQDNPRKQLSLEISSDDEKKITDDFIQEQLRC